MSEFTRDNGFLNQGAERCPDCYVSLHWPLIKGERVTQEVEGKYFYIGKCPKCKTVWLVYK